MQRYLASKNCAPFKLSKNDRMKRPEILECHVRVLKIDPAGARED